MKENTEEKLRWSTSTMSRGNMVLVTIFLNNEVIGSASFFHEEDGKEKKKVELFTRGITAMNEDEGEGGRE